MKVLAAKRILVSFTFAKSDFPVAAGWRVRMERTTRACEQPHATPTAFEIWDERLCYKHVIPRGIDSRGTGFSKKRAKSDFAAVDFNESFSRE